MNGQNLRLMLALLVVLGMAVGAAEAGTPSDLASIHPAAAPQDALTAPVQPLPHPILSDARVRKAIAYCTDKDALVASVHPDLTPAERQALIMDTFIPAQSWAYSPPPITYGHNPAMGQDLLDQAGWTLPPGADYRTKAGQELVLTVTTTTSSYRVTFLTVFEVQMKACGIRVIRDHQPAAWVFGDDTGLQVRDFEMGEFVWVTPPDGDPGGRTIYACDVIPSPTNGWQGQNYMGWCNQAASDAIMQATDPGLPQNVRKGYYAVVIDQFAQDLPSLPLFQRPDPGTTPSGQAEHIDFNLETYLQVADVAPATQTTLSYTDFGGNQGAIVVPAGAVTEEMTLGYHPLESPAHEPPENLAMATSFRLTGFRQGVPQESTSFSQPIYLTVTYSAMDLARVFPESTLNLYYWDGDSWEAAVTTCPEGDRYQDLDTDQNILEVSVCHLSEFALMGTMSRNRYFPLVAVR